MRIVTQKGLQSEWLLYTVYLYTEDVSVQWHNNRFTLRYTNNNNPYEVQGEAVYGLNGWKILLKTEETKEEIEEEWITNGIESIRKYYSSK
jgi:hypothetical protein